MRNAAEARIFLALIAGAVGVEICLYQQHFTLHQTAASFASMLTHRCGMVMTAALTWVAFELAHFFLKQILREPTALKA